LDRDAAARTRARAFLDRHPNGPFSARVRRVLE
jgi:hypothetical protein